MPGWKYDPAIARDTRVVVHAKIMSGQSEVNVTIDQTVGSTREALALIQHVLMNTGPLRVSEDTE